jgi:SAM-dependent methyltransferase
MASNFRAVEADGYEKIMGRFSRKLAGTFIGFTGHLPGEKILDVGCGTGSLSFALAALGDHAEIVGIDAAEPYVAFARSHNTDPRVTFRIGDASSLPFPNAYFDRAFSQLVFQFLPDPLPAVKEMRRVVRPGGMVAACVWDAYGGQPHIRMLWDTASTLGFTKSHNLIRSLSTDGEMEAMWRKAGLIDVTPGEIMMRFEFENFDDYWSPLLSGEGPMGEMVMSLTTEQRTTLEKQLRQIFLSNRPDGRRSFVAAAWICKGIVPLQKG